MNSVEIPPTPHCDCPPRCHHWRRWVRVMYAEYGPFAPDVIRLALAPETTKKKAAV